MATSMDMIHALQWPAMAVTVLAAWLIGSQRPGRRWMGFWCFIVSNALWIVWGLHADAWALIVLQLFLCGMNLRGLKKTSAGATTQQR